MRFPLGFHRDLGGGPPSFFSNWQEVCYSRTSNRMRFPFVTLLLTLGLLPVPRVLAVPEEAGREGALPTRSGNVVPGVPTASTPSGVRPSQVERSNERSSSGGYPLVYRQVGYLAAMGPMPMRFGTPSPLANERTPPRVSAFNKKPELSVSAQSLAQTEAIETYRSIHGRKVPVPEGYPQGGAQAPNSFFDQGAISTGSNEVLEFFQQPLPEADVQKRQNRFLFDPVPPFSSATPPATVAQPQSRATYQKN